MPINLFEKNGVLSEIVAPIHIILIAGLTERDGVGALVNQIAINAITSSLSRADDIWHRGAWRELLDQQ